MDWSSIIVAALAMIGTMLGTALANSKTTALISYRIEQLEKKVEKHNTIVERTYKLESDMDTAWKRIDEIKDDVHAIEHNKEGEG